MIRHSSPSSLLRRLARRFAGPLLTPFLSQQPAAQLLRTTARQQWKLLALNFGASLVEAFSEGATLGVIFLALELLSAPGGSAGLDLSRYSSIGVLGGLREVIVQAPRTPLFIGLLGLAVLLQALMSLAGYLNQLSVGYFAARCVVTVKTLIHQRILALTFACASRYRVGDLLNQATDGPDAINRYINSLSQLLLNGLLLFTYLAVLIALSPWLLLGAAGMALLITLMQQQQLPRIRDASRQLMASQVRLGSRITEDIQGLRLLHSMGQLEAADRTVRAEMQQLEVEQRRQSQLGAVIGPFSRFLPILAIAVIAALSLLAFQGRVTGVLPSLATFVVALQRLNMRLGIIAGVFTTLGNNTGAYERLNEILSPAGKELRRQGGVPFQELKHEIRFEGVSLRYAPELPPVLDQVSFRLPKGQTLALVGASGAGKSSIADLLVGLYAPSGGRIEIDGLDLARLDLASWQQRLGVVSQDTFLFNAALAENIAFGCSWATRADVQAAAAQAQAAGFIEALPEGYDTLVGERGYRLSGGQRQRISLARAILRNPELLILDEATSALDSQSERLVQQAIEQFERQRTVLVIAHRLSTIVNADQILVMEQGRVVEHGAHLELLGRQGNYRSLWQQQVKAVPATIGRTTT